MFKHADRTLNQKLLMKLILLCNFCSQPHQKHKQLMLQKTRSVESINSTLF
jgi:hypothetical protein